MRSKRWLVGVVCIGVLIALFFFLGKKQLSYNDGKKHFKVGVFEVVRHPVLDSMADAFRQTLEQKFPGSLDFVTMVAEGDASKTEQMAQKFATEGYDLVFVIGTGQAKSLMTKSQTLPIVLGGATDPKAAGLIDSWDKPGKNITGTSDLSPVDVQLNRLIEVMPKVKRIGIMYNPQEENSNVIVDRFKKECEKRGLIPVITTITNQGEIKQTLVSLVGKIDVFYAPTDATLQKGFPVLIKVANEVRIPVFNCDEGTAKDGAIFSVGFNYVDLGRISAEMAAIIIKGEAKPADMPIRLADHFSLFYNIKQMEKFKLTVPESWKKDGKQVGK